MRFESHELTAQVYLAGGDKPPCQGGTCGEHTKQEDATCENCSTTKCDTNTCGKPKDDESHKTASRNDLSLLRAQLRGALSV
jgi:hypothetical protein